MDKELKKQWIDALRSGNYDQTRGALRRSDESYCCIGVLCEVLPNVTRDSDNWYKWESCSMNTSLDYALRDELGLGKNVMSNKEKVTLQDKLIALNDDREWSFEKIADYLERVEF